MNASRRHAAWRLRTALTTAALAGAALLAACGSSSPSSSSSTAGGAATTSASAASDPGSSSAATGGSSGKSYTVSFGYIGTTPGLTGPWGYAYSKGRLQKWLAADGVTLKLAEFANGPLLTAAMVGGSVDMGVFGDTPALIAESQGLKAKLIGQPELNLVAWIIAQPSIHTLAQLSGKTVAVQQASYLDRYLQGLLAQKGMLSSVHRVAMLSAQSTSAFEAGSLDAVLAAPTQYPALLKNGKGYNVIAKSETTPSLEGTQAAVASDKLIAAHPNLPTVWNTARVRSVRYAKAHASDYYAWLAKQDSSTPAAAKESAPLSSYPIANFTATGYTHLQGTLNFLISQKEAKPFSIKSWELQSGS